MNNKFLASLFCISVLAFAPSCTKRCGNKNMPKRDDVNTMIELDDSVFEIEEETDTEKSTVKF